MPLLVEKPESLRPLFYPSKENLGTTQDLAGRKFASNSAQKDKVLNYFYAELGGHKPVEQGCCCFTSLKLQVDSWPIEVEGRQE